jgi:hypothetical protein
MRMRASRHARQDGAGAARWAVVAFALASRARDNALASFSLKHIDIVARSVFHDAGTFGRRTPSRASP